jgi:glycosyltransferase involved in cell wall biosynthesis
MSRQDHQPLGILTVTSVLQSRGGLAREHLTVMKGLAERGHRIDLIYRDDGDFRKDWEACCDSTTKVSHLAPSWRHALPFFAGVWKGARIARRCRSDLIYAYSPNFLFYAVLVGKLSRTPVVLWIAFQGPPRQTTWSYRYGFRHVRRTLSVSRATGQLWSQSKLDIDRIVPVLAGIDMDYYRPAPAGDIGDIRRDLGLEDEDFIILFTGRLIPEKGADVLLNAFAQLEDIPRAKLVITAQANPEHMGPWRQALLQQAADLDVVWIPRRKDIVPVLQMADVVAVPSVWHEAFGRAVCEPLACGVPVVASDTGGIPEIMEDWLARYLVPIGDANALAGAIRSLVGWRDNDPDLAERCRAAVVSRLSLDRFVDQIESELVSAVAPRPIPS